MHRHFFSMEKEAETSVGSAEIFILQKRHKSNVGQYLGFFKQGGKLVKTNTIFVVVVHISSTSEPGEAWHGNLCF